MAQIPEISYCLLAMLILALVETRTMTRLAEVRLELNDAIAVFEKKTKDASKNGGLDSKAKQKLLRELLADM